MLTFKKSFSSIFLIEGLLVGSLMSISEMRERKSCEYCSAIGGYVLLRILNTNPFMPNSNKQLLFEFEKGTFTIGIKSMVECSEFVENAPKRPNIRFLIVGLLLAYLGAQIIWCPNCCLCAIISMLQNTSNTKIPFIFKKEQRH